MHPVNHNSTNLAIPDTERRNSASSGIDEMSTFELLSLLNDQDHVAIEAVAAVLPDIANLVTATASRVRGGGSVHYFGAGTSGRLAVLDAAELLPTFNTGPEMVQAHIAGGDRALVHSVEQSEDSEEDGGRDAQVLTKKDVAIGLTASGGTAYVAGALSAARRRGALTALITSNQTASIAPLADIVIAPNTGSEVLTGSTRLKAGTAQKVILNGFSTALMVALGRTYSNLMVAVAPTNSKLRDRALRILIEIGGTSSEDALKRMDEAHWDLTLAVVRLLGAASLDDSRRAIETAGGSVREAVRLLTLGNSALSPNSEREY